MRIPPKTVFRVIRGTALFVFASVLIQTILAIVNKRGYGGPLTYSLHGVYVPIVLLTLVFLHATFGLVSMVSRSKYRESPTAPIAVIVSMAIAFILLIVLLVY